MGFASLRLAALATLLVSGVVPAQAQDSYDIDVILPLTGGAAFLGKAEQQALTLYEKFVAETGGVHGKPLKFVFHDDQSTPQTAVQLVNQIKSNDPAVILGSAVSGICNAIAPLMRRGPVLYCFSPSIDPEEDSFVFSSSTSTRALADGLLAFFAAKGWTKIGLITSTDATGQDAHKNILELVDSDAHAGVEIVEDQTFNPTDVSVAAQVQRLKGASPDAVIAWSTGAPIGTVLKAIKDAGLSVPVATTDGNMTYAQMEQYAAFMPAELYIPAPDWLMSDRPDQVPEEVAAKEAFFKTFEAGGVKPDGPSTFAWDPAALVIAALRNTDEGADAEAIRAYIDSLKGFYGINGAYDFEAIPNRGIGSANVVVTRWDAAAGSWIPVSGLGGTALPN